MYGRACKNCSIAKCRCIARTEGQSCERCHRLNKTCLPGNASRARTTQRNNPVARIAQLEGKLDNLVSLLVAGKPLDAPQTGLVSPSPPLSNSNSPSSASVAAVPAISVSTLSVIEPSEEQYLDYFRNHMLKYFPFLHITGDAQSLRQSRPFLLSCIVCAACQSTQVKLRLGAQIKKKVTNCIFLANDPDVINIDLLLGLLTFIAWGHDQLLNGAPALLPRLTQLALTLVFDLRLNKSPQEDSNMLPVGNESTMNSDDPIQSLEGKRAVLGCFVISSIVSVYFGHMDAMKWTPYLDECLEALNHNKESPYDEMFVRQVRLQRISGEVGETENMDEIRKAPPAFYLSFLQQKVKEIKSHMSPQLQQDRVLSASIYYTELSIFALVLSRKADSVQRLEHLYTCFNTVKSALDNFFTIPITDYPGICFPLFAYLVRYVIVLYKLSTLKDAAWDVNLVRSSLDIMQVVDRVISNLERCRKYHGDQSSGGIMERAIGIFQRFKSWCATRLPSVHTGDTNNIDFDLQTQCNSPLDGLFLDDWWWKETLDFGPVGNNLP
ncbi:phosphoketolase 1 [Penicillium macrosclerotiorum]|uniref:phosphoketolase 1 n=1 Tax=Penicillium macrosclerotiorum TaxID=303699 RepID=UPI0025497063|nr:phosphoketolase 1 [Penicillium macrosclerotiorum]KAJ5682236.1 phosphoketolase 1 [Penicillium macrosclerotiorum]